MVMIYLILLTNLVVSMKLICIKSCKGKYGNFQLAVGDIYETTDSYDEYVTLIRILYKGEEVLFSKSNFIPLQENRENIINKIVNDE